MKNDKEPPALKTTEGLRTVMREKAREASLSPDTMVNRLGDLLDMVLDDVDTLINHDK